MYACKQCGTGNPLDSSFCKKCGAALPEQELTEARTKLNEVLEEGNNLFTEGRTDEAMLIAEAAVAANPSSHMAYSLKGLCHERQGQIAEALECYETAVGLNPDSALDKVKVAALRNRLAQHVHPVEEPNPRRAMTMAALAGIAVLALASLAAIGFSSKRAADKPKPSGDVAMNIPQPNTTSSLPVMPGAQTQAPQTQTSQPTAVTNPQGTGPNLPTFDPKYGLPDTSGRGSVTLDPGEDPVVVHAPPTGDPTGSAHKPDGGVDTPPAVITQGGGDSPTPPKPTDNGDKDKPGPGDPGFIEIKFAETPKPMLGGSQPADDGNAAAAVLKAAQDLFQMGKFDSAASKYRQVAGIGGDSARVEQRLGDCYRNLGKSDQARSAYNRAITMYQSQIKLGHDVPFNQRGLDSCESALKVLGG